MEIVSKLSYGNVKEAGFGLSTFDNEPPITSKDVDEAEYEFHLTVGAIATFPEEVFSSVLVDRERSRQLVTSRHFHGKAPSQRDLRALNLLLEDHKEAEIFAIVNNEIDIGAITDGKPFGKPGSAGKAARRLRCRLEAG